MKILKLFKFSLLVLTTTSTAYAAQFGGQTEDVVAEARETASQMNPTTTVESSEDLAYNFLDSVGIGEGWDDERSMLVAVGTAIYPVSDPSTDSDFVRQRLIKSTEAALNAKRSIIQFIRTELSVENTILTPDVSLSTEFDEKLRQLKSTLEQKKRAYQQALAEVDSTAADIVGGVSSEELAARGVVAAFNERGAQIDFDAMSASASAKLKKAQDELLALESAISSIKAEAEQLKGALLQENTSAIETFASMPLVGAMTAAQFESWVDGEYAVTNVLVWSPKQEKNIRALVDGVKNPDLPKGKQSLSNFIKQNNWATATGGRKFLDDQGNYYVLGIGAWPIAGKGSAARRTAEGMALNSAQSTIALALKGDTTAQSRAAIKSQEIKGEMSSTETQVVSNFAEELVESAKGINLQGAQRKFGRKLKDPISGQDMFVVVLALGVNEAGVAKEAEKSNYEAAEDLVNKNQYSQGVKQGLEESLIEEIQNRSEVDQGRMDAQAPPVVEVVEPAPSTKTAGEVNGSTGQNTNVTGAGTSKDAFSW